MAQWLRELKPGDWYAAGDDSFEIVGIDVQTELVLVQHFDGTLEEFDFDVWIELAAVPCAPPEDISGALDMDREDLDTDAIASTHEEDALNRLDLDSL